MKEIIEWLREIERLACEMYEKAASVYANDNVLKKFLENNAEDEAWHFHVMGSAALFLASEPDYVAAISVDKEINEKIINKISALNRTLEQKTLARNKLIDQIVDFEVSEWNDIFLYAITFLKEKSSKFNYPAARIQNHLREIEFFLSSVEQRPEALLKIKELPPVWIENILIVDDDKMITDLIKSLLNRIGNIDMAHNGQDALELIEQKYYKLIISDIDMPIMDGLALYRNAVEKHPGLKNRFLFMTGDLSSDKQSYFDAHQLSYLTKPMSITELRREAERIIISK